MSRLFGEMRQVGIVVRDIEAAMRHWLEVCGVGPSFYADGLAVTDYTCASSSMSVLLDLDARRLDQGVVLAIPVHVAQHADSDDQGSDDETRLPALLRVDIERDGGCTDFDSAAHANWMRADSRILDAGQGCAQWGWKRCR